MKIFKIRNRATGLFSTGGQFPRWTKRGKTWSGMGHVKTHINNLSRAGVKDINQWEVVEYELVETVVNTINVTAIIEEKIRAAQLKELERQREVVRKAELKASAISKLTKEEREALHL